MAYPSPGTPQSTSFNGSVTSMAVNMPTSTTSGDLLIAVAEVRNPGTWTVPSGWTQLFTPVSAGGVGDFTVFYRTATGSEGGTTETWTASVSTTGVWLTVDISGWDSSSTPAFATKNSGGSPSTNSFNAVTPTWGSASTLWLALYGNTANGTTVSSAPSGYSGLTVQSTISGGGSYCCVAYADLQATATSETPGAFSTSSDRWWMTAAIAIKPASGATNATVAQVAATLTVSGGTQVVATIQDVAVSQAAATVTSAAGTQSVATVYIVSLSQVAANITVAGGIQGIQNIQDVAITQKAANLIVSGGTQAIATVQDSAISQVAANVTATGGQQGIQDIQDVSLSQIVASITANSGTQSLSTVNILAIAQVAAELTASGGMQLVSANGNVTVSQVAASISVIGGTQVVATYRPTSKRQHRLFSFRGGKLMAGVFR